MRVEVSSHNEWAPLETVIVGTARGARVPQADRSLRAINYADLKPDEKIHSGPYPEQVIDETEEDLEKLCSALRSFDVQVLRPETPETEKVFGNGLWQSDGYYGYCPRDSVLVIGDFIIETPMPLRARQQETRIYRKIFKSASKNGARWISAPRPQLPDEAYQIEGITRERLALNEVEPCFDAANVLRCGEDLLYLISNSGNELGADWLQATLGSRYRVHKIKGVYSYIHIDSTFSCLREGLVLLNPSRVNEKNMPDFFKSWDKIWCPEPHDIGYYGPYRHASPWIGMNLLMVNPGLAIVEEHQTELIQKLASQRIEACPLPIRHARTLGGAFHCVTLDLKRRS